MINFIQFTLTRAFLSIVTLLIVCFIVFSLMELVPGTCAERYLAFKNTQGSQITFEDIEAEKVRLGLDKPFLYRFGKWVTDIAVKQDFGDSCILRISINELLSGRFLLSLTIAITALIFSYLIAIPVGIISASTKYVSLDQTLKFISYLGIALPNFLVALCIMLFMTVYLGVHDVGDVLGGILLGALTLYVWVKLDVAGRLIAGLELFGLPKLE